MDFRRLARRARLALAIPRWYGIAATRYGFHPLQGARSLAAALDERYVPAEAYDLGLLRPGADARKTPQFVSKSRMVGIQRQLNPTSWEFALTDKGVFAWFSRAAGLPTPRLLALYIRNGAGHTGGGRPLLSRSDWLQFLETETPEEIVVKPTRGAYGRAVRLFRRKGVRFTDFEGRALSADDILTLIEEDPRRGAFLVQERVRNHPDLITLSGAEGLQTVRITTFVSRDRAVHIAWAFFKPIVGDNEVDNFRHGTTGNLIAGVETADGSLTRALTFAPGGGASEVVVHPGTGTPFQGFRLPLWQEACALVRRAAPAFLPVRLVGWDVALTPSGPLLIEGNFWSDPPTLSCPLDRIVPLLDEG